MARKVKNDPLDGLGLADLGLARPYTEVEKEASKVVTFRVSPRVWFLFEKLRVDQGSPYRGVFGYDGEFARHLFARVVLYLSRQVGVVSHIDEIILKERTTAEIVYEAKRQEEMIKAIDGLSEAIDGYLRNGQVKQAVGFLDRFLEQVVGMPEEWRGVYVQKLLVRLGGQVGQLREESQWLRILEGEFG